MSFWAAKIGYKPSYSWKRIHKARELLEEGTRWNIGNGATVSIWKDKWLSISKVNRILTAPRILDPNSTVKELIDHAEHRWRNDLAEQIFNPLQAAKIQSIPLGDANRTDYLVWQHSKTGNFTVKSAYYLA